MSYVKSVLQPNERLLFVSRIHWMVYVPSLLALAVASGFAFLFASGAYVPNPLGPAVMHALMGYAALGILALSAFMFASAWLVRFGTEIAVTDKRVIHKRGLVWRRTKEINMDKIESVDVDQGIMGRILDFGTVTIRGTGSATAPFHGIDNPLQFRNSITARDRLGIPQE